MLCINVGESRDFFFFFFISEPPVGCDREDW